MPPEEMTTGTLYMINADTGEKTELMPIQTLTVGSVGNLDKCGPIDFDREISFDIDINKISRKTLLDLMYNSISAKGSLEEIAKKIFRELPLGAKIQAASLRQSKTHKKKRINKKWAKRYGYICTVYYL